MNRKENEDNYGKLYIKICEKYSKKNMWKKYMACSKSTINYDYEIPMTALVRIRISERIKGYILKELVEFSRR